jgi:hypothetical protein
LSGAGFGGEAFGAGDLVVVGLGDGGVGLVAAGGGDAFVLVVNPRGGLEDLLEPPRAVQRRRPPQRKNLQHLARDVDPPLRADLLLYEAHGEHRRQHVGRDRLAVRAKRGRHGVGQVGRQVVPLPRHLAFVQENLGLFHWSFLPIP